MSQPQRGEIWHVELGKRRLGTELHGPHPCLVISNSKFNLNRRRITVVPITSYNPLKEEKRSLWGITIAIPDAVDIDYSPYKIDPLSNGKGFRIWVNKEQTIPFRSVIDCGQVWTISKLPKNHLSNELDWDRRHGELKEVAMLQVDAALQVIIGECVRFHRNNISELPYQAGDVIELNLQTEFMGPSSPHRCLVISSTGVDAIRERIQVFRQQKKKYVKLRHCTVVPLLPPNHYTPRSPSDVVEVTVISHDKSIRPQKQFAIYQEIYTVNWPPRIRTSGVVGSVSDEDIAKVRQALRFYLYLPAKEYE